MKLETALKKLGLSEVDVEIYLATLKVAGSQPASIIANRLNMNRTTAYKGLLNLANKGLITKTMRHGIICFFAEEPEEKLKKLLDTKKQTLEEANQVILEALPTLTLQEQPSMAIPKIRYYEGVEGLKQIYEAVLKEGVDYDRYGDISKIYDVLGDFADEYLLKGKKLQVTSHAIMPYHKVNEKLHRKNKEGLIEALYIPLDLFSIDGEILIFGNKVAILSLKNESLLGVIIESDIVAKMFKSIFMLTWKGYNKRAFRTT